jgi:hypothetical protein
MLTPKQEKFCQCIVSGKDGITSYMTAYNCTSKHAASIESTKLLKRDDITERIAEISKPVINLVQNTTISARQRQIDEILERISICKQKDDETSIIRYMDMLNKIYALYKDSETEQKQDNSINNLDMNTLKKLSGVS